MQEERLIVPEATLRRTSALVTEWSQDWGHPDESSGTPIWEIGWLNTALEKAALCYEEFLMKHEQARERNSSALCENF
jgi:hypothetical protein